ncbi:TonB-dependent receptor, partial [Xylella fastidiosa subsp. multiplex]|nr:TonB-dependent receptor [Xylella fastidiosa subsp. multiplex]
IGKRAGDEHNTSFERGVAVADATVHYERGPWRLALNVSNLFNRKYFSGCYHGENGARTAAWKCGSRRL